MTLTLNIIQNGINLTIWQRINPPEACVEISAILGDLGQCIINLIKKRGAFIRNICHCNFAFSPKRHFPIAIKSTSRINAYGDRRDLRKCSPARGKEISDRCFNRRLTAILPIKTDYILTPNAAHRHPYLLNGAGSVNFSQCNSLARLNKNIRGYFPTLSQISCTVFCKTV